MSDSDTNYWLDSTVLLYLAMFLIVILALVHVARGQTRVAVHGLSVHYDEEVEYNNQNPGIGLQQRLTPAETPYRSSAQLGAYHNSVDNLSVYLAVEQALEIGPLGLGIVAQVATGYKHGTAEDKAGEGVVQIRGPGLAPMAFLTGTVDFGTLRLRVLSLPQKITHVMMSVQI